MKFNVKSMFNQNQIAFIVKIMKSNIPLEEKELIVKELEIIIQSNAIQRADTFFQEISETHMIGYDQSW